MGKMLSRYCDKQLIHLIRFGFPIDFNRNCTLLHDDKNLSSALDYPADIKAYLTAEIQHGPIMGPYQINPIPNCQISPFMTRENLMPPNKRIIIDLSWAKHNSVNAGVDNNSYLGSEFSLMFPTIDYITNELVKIDPGSHIYKIDISRTFRPLKIHPLDYDLLGLRVCHWGADTEARTSSASVTLYVTSYIAMVMASSTILMILFVTAHWASHNVQLTACVTSWNT